MARILLVDDDFDIRELGRALLSHAGHEVHTADGALNAMKTLREFPFDVMITDVNMPNHNGFDLLKMVRLENKWPRLVTAILTGRRNRGDIEAAAREGVQAYVVKPLEPELFVSRIEELLEKNDVVTPMPTVDFSMSGQVQMSIEICSVSELGITIKSPYQFRSGSLIPLESALFRRIGIANPLTRVFVSQKKEGEWETRLTFVDLNTADADKLRFWTAQQQPTRKGRAG